MKHTIYISTLFLLLSACKQQTTVNHAEEAAEMNDSSLITLSAAQMAQAGVELGEFSSISIPEELALKAEMQVNPEHLSAVSAPSEGILQDLRVRLNQPVAQGAVVAVLRKPDLLDLQQNFLENREQLRFLENEYARLKALKEGDATAVKNFQKAEADLRASQTTNQLLAAKLRQVQIDPQTLGPDNLKTELLLRAPRSGVVTAISAHPGAALSAGQELCELTNFAHLHPVLYVLEKDLSRVKVGQNLRLQVGESTLRAHIQTLERYVDPERKTLRAHAAFEPGQGRLVETLAIGSFAEAFLSLGVARAQQALPEEAIVREADGTFIFVQTVKKDGEASFQRIAVRLGAQKDGMQALELLEALPNGGQVVLKGAYYVAAQGAGIEIDE
jgi:membrane fusion protein, heavy metal efflux system